MRCDKESNGKKDGELIGGGWGTGREGEGVREGQRGEGARFHLDQRCEERADRAKGSTGESGLPPLWQFSVSCRIPTHWKLRNTEEAQKGYGFEIKRTSDGDADTGDYSVTPPPPRENKPFFPLGGGGASVPRQRCRHRAAAPFGLSAVPVPGHRVPLRFFAANFCRSLLCSPGERPEGRMERSRPRGAEIRTFAEAKPLGRAKNIV